MDGRWNKSSCHHWLYIAPANLPTSQNSSPSTKSPKADKPRDGPQHGKLGTRNRLLKAGMHLMFAVILFSLAAGFLLRAIYGANSFVDQVGTQ